MKHFFQRFISVLVSAAALLSSLHVVCAQTDITSDSSPQTSSRLRAQTQGDDELESYLESLSLTDLHAQFLFDRLLSVPRDQRIPIAERLSKLFVQLLSSSPDPQRRREIEQRSEELFRLVPEADSIELRLNLSKAVYTPAEEIVERGRVRLVKIEELQEAETTLKGLEPAFREIAGKVHQRVQSLEAREQSGQESPELSTQLAEARRLRSLAFYYAGWCNYYIALIADQSRLASGSTDKTSVDRPASDALKCFGWLLDSPNNRAPLVDRASPAKFKYEHVARAAIGCALASALRGDDVQALRWLDAVSEAQDVPQAVQDQMLSRRIIVLAGSRRWADLERLIRLERKSDRSGGGPDVVPLSVINARLLAVETLRADRRFAADEIDSLARIALGDLVTRSETNHVLDLVTQFGTTLIGDSGFIVNYVRGVQAYERARTAHLADLQTQSPPTDGRSPAEEPADKAATINLYLNAASLLRASLNQSDAAQFPKDCARAGMTLGRARYFAGEMLDAADAFQKAFETFGQTKEGEEALWLTIISLDRAVEGKAAGLLGANKSTQERRNQTIAYFLQVFPDSERAGRLLLMQISSGLISQDESIRVLMGVSKESVMYIPARRQLARMLYERLRSSSGSAREVAAIKFIEIADEVLSIERSLVTDSTSSQSPQAAAQRAILLGRQMLDALLSVSAPDAQRAAGILQTVEAVAKHQSIDLSEFVPELLYRRVQIKLAAGDQAGAIADADALHDLVSSSTPPRPVAASSKVNASNFSDAADRLLYRNVAARVLSQIKANTQPDSVYDPSAALFSLDDARLLVRFGIRVLDRLDQNPKSIRDPAVLGAYSTVAMAACILWKNSNDLSMRDLSIRLDKRILSVEPGARESLARVSLAFEDAGDLVSAFDAWVTRLSGEQTGSLSWFEARFNALRLLLKIDHAKAALQIRQHESLYPDFGPAPWGERIRSLKSQLPPESSSTQATPPDGSPQPGGGA